MPASPGRMRRIEMTFQPESITSRRNRTSERLRRLGGSPEDARRSVAVAVTEIRRLGLGIRQDLLHSNSGGSVSDVGVEGFKREFDFHEDSHMAI